MVHVAVRDANVFDRDDFSRRAADVEGYIEFWGYDDRLFTTKAEAQKFNAIQCFLDESPHTTGYTAFDLTLNIMRLGWQRPGDRLQRRGAKKQIHVAARETRPVESPGEPCYVLAASTPTTRSSIPD